MSHGSYEAVIGLECHAQLLTRTKLFCGCRAGFGDPPNTNVCPVCVGLPGALPVLNRRAVELATRMALAVGCLRRTRTANLTSARSVRMKRSCRPARAQARGRYRGITSAGPLEFPKGA